MMDREAVLLSTLRQWRASPFAWGASDCLMSVMTYARDLCGRDPGAPWRGGYSNEAGAMAFLSAAGGAVPLLGNALEACGFARTEQHTRGDIIIARFGADEVGGLWLGDFAAFRLAAVGTSERQARFVKVVAAWH